MPSERAIRALCALFAAASYACSGPELKVLEPGPPSFFGRDGTTFVDRGAPYRFVGYDAFALTGCPPAPDSAEIDAFFASLRPRSMVRTYAFEPIGLEGVERVVAAARAHGHLLTLVLTDHSSSCGEGEDDKTAAFYEGGFRAEYLPWVRQVVDRFANEPTVAMWEPVKAARDVDAQVLRSFYDAIGGEIHGLDRNHLVEAGTHGPWAYDGDAGYALIGESAGIDVLSFHDYNSDEVPPLNLEASMRAAAPLGKPMVLVEMGLYAGLTASSTPGPDGEDCVSWEDREDAARVKLDASFAASVAGVLLWNWSQEGGVGCSYTISENDPTFALVRTYPIP